MRIALVHDWFTDIGGAERTLMAMHRMWPEAPIHLLVHDPAMTQKWLPNATIVSSGLQRIPHAWKFRSLFAPLMPSAAESLNFSAYDTVISSSVLFSKGIVVRPGTRHICYCYSPARPLWDRHATYERKGMLSTLFRHGLRQWDHAAAQRPDEMVAISQTIADRIGKFYRRDAVIIPPPTRTVLPLEEESGSYYLTVGRLMPHKNFGVLIETFNRLKRPLVVVGSGPLQYKLARNAGAHIQFRGSVDDNALDHLYAGCRGVILANEEDWGLTAVEAMAHGKPVLALRRGGALETVIEGVCGEFFDDAIPEAIADGVKRLERNSDNYNPSIIRNHAAQWSEEKFEKRFRTFIEQ